jgi:hypothetical protein
MSKPIQFLANVTKNSNRITVDSNTELLNLKSNSLIRVGDSDYFYSIRKIEEIRVVKDFTVVDSFNIKIEDYKNVFVKNDSIDLSTKQYEIQTISQIHPGDINFERNELLGVEGGNPIISSFDGQSQEAKLRYLDPTNLFHIFEKGKYIVPPENPVRIYSSQSSNFVLMDLVFKESDERKIHDRIITKITKPTHQDAILTLDSPLDAHIKLGKISTRKYQLVLTEAFEEATQNNVLCTINSDFTPYLGLPFVSKNSLSHEVLQNRAFIILDEKIKELSQEIAQLKKDRVI